MRQSLLRSLPTPSLRDACILKDLSADFRVEFQEPQQGEWQPFWRVRGFILLKLLATVRLYGHSNISAPIIWCLPSWSQRFPFISWRLQVAGTGQELEACALSLSDLERVIQPLSASVFPASVVGMRCIPATLAHYRNSARWKITWHSHQDSMVLAQRQKYRSMEQNRKPRDKSMNLWTPYLQQKRRGYTMEKRQSL